LVLGSYLGSRFGKTDVQSVIFFISNTFLKIFPSLTLYFFFKSNTFGRAYCPGVAKQCCRAMHGGAAEAMTWQGPGAWPVMWQVLPHCISWRDIATPSRMAWQRRVYVAPRASLPRSALLRMELEGACVAPSCLSQGLPPPGAPSGAPCPPPSLPSPKCLLGLDHGNDALICCLNGGFKDYEW